MKKRDRRRRPGSKWAAYNRDLVRRTNKVFCPMCRAAVGEFCIEIYGRDRGKEKRATNHWERRYNARLAGFVGNKRRKKK